MASSEEYLAALGFDTSDMEASAKRAASILGALGDVFEGLEKRAGKAEINILGASKATKQLGTDAKNASKATSEGSDKWRDYAKALADANDAYREFKRGQVTGEGGGTDLAAVSRAQQNELLQTHKATTSNIITDIQRQRTAEEKAVEQSIADYKRQADERTAAYTRAFNAATKLDAQIAEADRRAAATKASEIGGRSYANASVISDSSIAQRESEAKSFSSQLRAQMQAQADTEAATKKTTKALNEQSFASKTTSGSLVTLRYALYDVATTYGIVGAAALSASGYAVSVATKFESAFTGVQRTLEDGTTADEIDNIRAQLVDLSTQIPVTFEDLARIGTLGNQLGVPAAKLTDFTETVSKFSAVTGISVDSASQSFGKLKNILGLTDDDYNSLGSSITYVGRTSAATEQEIISLAERLGSTATRAGFTADQVIGLGGALASLGVAPERAQGVLETYFNSLNESLSEGGDKLKAFSAITGLSADKLNELVRSGQGFEVFQRFITTLNSTGDNVQLTAALDALGLSGLRANEVIPRLASNMDLLQQSFANADQGFTQGTELTDQFNLVVDDLASQFQLLVNNLNALVDTVTGGMVPGLAAGLVQINLFLKGLNDFAKTDAGGAILRYGLALVTIVGILASVRAASFLATASLIAINTAQSQLAATGARGGFLGLVSALTGISTQGRAASGGLLAANVAAGQAASGITAVSGASVVAAGRLSVLRARASVAFSALGKLALAAAAVGALSDPAGAVNVFADALNTLLQAALTVGSALLFVKKEMDIFAVGLISSGNVAEAATKKINNAYQGAIKDTKGVIDGVVGFVRGLAPASSGVDDLSGSLDDTDWNDYADGADYSGGSLDDFGSSADDAAAEVRTLVDYASDLQTVFGRAFDIRFGGSQAQDTIASGWNAISKSIADTNQQIAEYQASMSQLTADRAVQTYFLTVADAFGNTLRAGNIRAGIADIDTKLTKTASDLSAAQEKNSGVLEGNSQAAIDNRATLLDLVQNYEAYIGSLASAGLTQEDLQAKTAAAKDEFIRQATALGFPIAQVSLYADAFDDVATAIGGVPRNITVAANTNPALQALNELDARARQISGTTYSGPSFSDNTDSKGVRRIALEAEIVSQSQRVSKSGSEIAERALAALREKLRTGNYYTGGWTGSGGKREVAGLVHGQEYVLNATGAQMFPRQVLDAANQGRAVYSGSPKSSSGGGGMSLVELGPESLRSLREAMQNDIYVMLGDREVAESAARGNKKLARDGNF